MDRKKLILKHLGPNTPQYLIKDALDLLSDFEKIKNEEELKKYGVIEEWTDKHKEEAKKHYEVKRDSFLAELYRLILKNKDY